MTAANVTNTHTSPLGVGGVTIPPGATARVENWESVKRGNAVKLWLSGGYISSDAAEDRRVHIPGLDLDKSTDPDLADKQALIDKLAALGIEKTTRTSKENLQKALDEATAKAAPAGGAIPGL